MCKICNKKFKNINSLGKHVRILHNYKLLEYFIKYENFNIPNCKYCDKLSKNRYGLNFLKTCGGDVCKKLLNLEMKHSDESKKLISERRKKWLKDNPEKHPWRRKENKLSIPCEYLKEQFLKNGLKFESEVQPLEDRFFSIDIAFVDKGIGIEVNGNQHYNSEKKLKDYYKERKELIEKKGWKLYDIHYTKVYDLEFVDNLISVINGIDINIDLHFNLKKKVENKCVCGNKIQTYSRSGKCVRCVRFESRKVERPSIEQLKIDIKELGYAGTGRKYGVSDNAIRKWIK